MNKKLFLIIFLTFANIFAQSNSEIIFKKSYKDFPIKLRIENCGIYFISGFDILGHDFYFKPFDDKFVLKYSVNNQFEKINLNHKTKDFCIIDENKIEANSTSDYGKVTKVFNGAEQNVFFENNGSFSNIQGELINIIKIDDSKLELKINFHKYYKNFNLFFNKDLACADFIGIDKYSNIFLIVEKFISQVPLKIKRFVYVLNFKGEIKSVQELISQKYFYTVNDLRIDEEGNLYQLFSDEEKVSIIKYYGLSRNKSLFLVCPENFSKEIHYNNFVKNTEFEMEEFPKTHSAASRSVALRLGENYVYQRYFCKINNLAPLPVPAPDGDIVQTPSWLVEGWNARIPYKWGGFDDLSQYISGLSAGKYAGDINTSGVSGYAKGVDCSGFVSRCWQLTYHASTSYMPNITTKYSSWSQLKPGDGVHKVGHVRLFVKFNQNGSLRVVESAGRNWDVSYWSFPLSDLTSYSPLYYNSMISDYSDKWINLLSAKLITANKVELKWSDDTTNVNNYKIYDSEDGIIWTVRATISKPQNSVYQLNKLINKNYFRISSVLNNGFGGAESFYSNALCAVDGDSVMKALIVDGFNRDNSSWQGIGHNFVINYAKSLKKSNLKIESCKNSEIKNELFQLNDYKYIFWFVGEESTFNETLDSTEQRLIKNYLENGGNLFISGSEIAYDIYQNGTAYDREFFANYLKAKYISDNSNDKRVRNNSPSIYDTISFYIGQTYYEDSPDAIDENNGSSICLKYFNNLNAGICYNGSFGNSSKSGKLIYLSFALETTADEIGFDFIISKSVMYFNTSTAVKNEVNPDNFDFSLSQNYPNPFNPSTVISYQLTVISKVSLKIYDVLGKEIETLIDKEQEAGKHLVQFNGTKYSSGIYYYELIAGNYHSLKKMILIK